MCLKMIFVASAQPTPRITTPYIPHHLSLYPTPSGVGGVVYITPLPTPIKGGRLTRRTVLSPKFSKNFRHFQKGSPHLRIEDIICDSAYYIWPILCAECDITSKSPGPLPLSSRMVCFSKNFSKKIQSHRLFITIIHETIE